MSFGATHQSCSLTNLCVRKCLLKFWENYRHCCVCDSTPQTKSFRFCDLEIAKSFPVVSAEWAFVKIKKIYKTSSCLGLLQGERRDPASHMDSHTKNQPTHHSLMQNCLFFKVIYIQLCQTSEKISPRNTKQFFFSQFQTLKLYNIITNTEKKCLLHFYSLQVEALTLQFSQFQKCSPSLRLNILQGVCDLNVRRYDVPVGLRAPWVLTAVMLLPKQGVEALPARPVLEKHKE